VADVIVQDEEDLVADYEQHPSQQANNNNGILLSGDFDDAEAATTTTIIGTTAQKLPFFKRALPPLPKTVSNGHVEATTESLAGNVAVVNGTQGAPARSDSPVSSMHQVPQARAQQQTASTENIDEPLNEDTSMDFAASIEKVKDVSERL
jgi:hypothetical protein